MSTDKPNAGDNPVMDWIPIQDGVEILVASCHRNQEKLQPALQQTQVVTKTTPNYFYLVTRNFTIFTKNLMYEKTIY